MRYPRSSHRLTSDAIRREKLTGCPPVSANTRTIGRAQHHTEEAADYLVVAPLHGSTRRPDGDPYNMKSEIIYNEAAAAAAIHPEMEKDPSKSWQETE